MQQQETLEEQLMCALCMCTFKNPVTIECGHSFCKLCLLNFIRSKHECPVCRAALSHVSEHLPQNQVIASIVEYLQSAEGDNAHSFSRTGHVPVDHFENLLLIDIRCSELLLPFTKVHATFQLQSQSLESQFGRFVARQQFPYNKYGLVAKITWFSQLRHNLYECIVEGRSFCEIGNEVTQRRSDQIEQYMFKTCQAKIIYEDEQIDVQLLETFRTLLNEIKQKEILKNLWRNVDYDRLYSKTNVVAAYYSVVKLMAAPEQNKYETVISFQKQRRERFVREFLDTHRQYIGKEPHKFVRVDSDGWKKQSKVLFLVFFVVGFIFMFNFTTSDL